MTQEDKELLLKDLSARLLYGVIVQESPLHPNGFGDDKIPHDYRIIGIKGSNTLITDKTITRHTYAKGYITESIEICIQDGITKQVSLPYLRPMSSMTEEEKWEFNELGATSSSIQDLSINEIDWLNAHHFDYRGLIDKGLALEAPKEMYNVK